MGHAGVVGALVVGAAVVGDDVVGEDVGAGTHLVLRHKHFGAADATHAREDLSCEHDPIDDVVGAFVVVVVEGAREVGRGAAVGVPRVTVIWTLRPELQCDPMRHAMYIVFPALSPLSV